MNKQIIRAFFCITLISGTAACKKDFLKVVPMGMLIAKNTDDYDKLMNSRDFYYYRTEASWVEPVLMGDEIAAEADYFQSGYVLQEQLFQWADNIYRMDDGEPLTLKLALQNMYTCNKVITEVMKSTGGTEEKKAALLAEAKATRAWLNFQFINYYAKPYLASTASSDPGFPIIDKADATVMEYSRASVQAVYDFIIKDLKDAIGALPVRVPAIRTRMSRPAAEGLLGKVYLFMGRYNDALPLLEAAFTDLKLSEQVTLYDYNLTFGPDGSFLPIDDFSGPNSPANNYNDLTEDIVTKFFAASVAYSGVVLAPSAAALFEPGDLRLKFYTTNNPDGSPNAYGRLRKYGTSYSRFGLQLSELYLLRAECKARLNDLPGATDDLEILRRHRMPVNDAPVPGNVAGDQAALIKFIIDERTREFAMEGYRWFDMRRLSIDPLFAGRPITHTIFKSDNSTTVYTLKQPERLVLRFAPFIMNANPNMPNNP